MTQFLSRALGAVEPIFSQGIQQLERAAGQPSADIRLTTEVTAALRTKIAELGLDPRDTTGAELYSALQRRLEQDEATIRQQLHIEANASADSIVRTVQQFLAKHDMPKKCFALKASASKRLLKKKLPKNAMKLLGYRSVDSMLKHETPASLYAAAAIAEPPAWHQSFRAQYDKLSPSDFEMRDIVMVRPFTKHWDTLAAGFVRQHKHSVLAYPELGAVVLLPVQTQVDGLATTLLLLVLEELNIIRAHSSYAKLQQVQPNFGAIMRRSSLAEPYTSAQLAGQPVPWRTIQRFYASSTDHAHQDIFEPHVQRDDLEWYRGERALAAIAPVLKFWEDTAHLGMLAEDGSVVSCNVLDVALNYCNHLDFADRVVHFMRDNLWHELMMRYLHQGNLESAVRQQIAAELEQPLALTPEAVYAET
ncbi:MAG TPA: hypothetical protein VLF91_05900 [Candidatus Saccharimonadales bacterium]|nr:hypothetical protein [Candidatus Saccharimonadales bacterium]